MDFRFVLVLIIILPMGLATAVLATRAWAGQQQAKMARTWPQTSGWVIASNIQQTAVRQRRSIGLSGYRMVTRYAPQIVYEYEVNGLRYRSERRHMGEVIVSSGTETAEKEIGRYPTGHPVTVYYNPTNPGEATLDPRPGWGTFILWLTASVMLLITIAVVVTIFSSPPIHF